LRLANPTMTILALSMRASEHLAEEMKKQYLIAGITSRAGRRHIGYVCIPSQRR
jgi:hypothetical protein